MATLLGHHFHIMVNNLKQYFNANANMETEDRFHIFIVKQYILKKFLAWGIWRGCFGLYPHTPRDTSNPFSLLKGTLVKRFEKQQIFKTLMYVPLFTIGFFILFCL